MKYSNRVQALFIHRSAVVNIGSSVFEGIINALPSVSSSIFSQNLRSLRWEMDPHTLRFLEPLCNKNIANLEMEFCTPWINDQSAFISIDTFLRSLAFRCPGIKNFVFRAKGENYLAARVINNPLHRHVACAVSKALIGLKNIETVNYTAVSPLNDDAWMHLAGLKSLASIESRLYSSGPPIVPRAFDFEDTSALKILFVNGPGVIPWLMSFLSLRQSWNIMNLDACSSGELSYESLKSLLIAIGERFSTDALVCLSIAMVGTALDQELDRTLLLPLAHFTRLNKIDIRFKNDSLIL